MIPRPAIRMRRPAKSGHFVLDMVSSNPVLGKSGAAVAVAGADVETVDEPVEPVDAVDAAHVGLVMVFLSNVTAALRAKARPCIVALVFKPTEVKAMIVPTNVELVPRVAELETCQKTLHA